MLVLKVIFVSIGCHHSIFIIIVPILICSTHHTTRKSTPNLWLMDMMIIIFIVLNADAEWQQIRAFQTKSTHLGKVAERCISAPPSDFHRKFSLTKCTYTHFTQKPEIDFHRNVSINKTRYIFGTFDGEHKEGRALTLPRDKFSQKYFPSTNFE